MTTTKLAVTAEEGAEMLSIGRSTMFDLLATGAIPSFKVGSCRRVEVVALEEFIRRRVNDERPPKRAPDSMTTTATLTRGGARGPS